MAFDFSKTIKGKDETAEALKLRQQAETSIEQAKKAEDAKKSAQTTTNKTVKPAQPTLLGKISKYLSKEERQKRQSEFNKQFLGEKVATQVSKIDKTEPTKSDALLYGALKSSDITGIVENILPESDKQRGEIALKKFPVQGTIGQIGGYISPSSTGTKIVAPLIKPLEKASGNLLARTAEGALIGGGIGLSESALPVLKGEITPQQAGKNVLENVATGAVFDVGIGVLSKLGKGLATKVQLGKPLSQSEKLQVEKAISEVGGNVNKTVDKTNNIVKPLLKETVDATEQSIPKATVSIPNNMPQRKPTYTSGELPALRPKVADSKFKRGATVNYMGDDYVIIEPSVNQLKVADTYGNETIIPKDFYSDLKVVETKQKPIKETEFFEDIRTNDSKRLIQEEHPETAVYYKRRAKELLDDINNSVKGERVPMYDEQRNLIGYEDTSSSRLTSDTMANIIDDTGATYDEIKEALKIITEGGESNALAKRIETFIDNDLINGYKTIEGEDIPSNVAFKSIREKLSNVSSGFPDDYIKYKRGKFDKTPISYNEIVKPISQSAQPSTHIVKSLSEQPTEQIVKPLTEEIQRSKTVTESAKSTDRLTIPVDEQAKQKFRRTTEYSVQNSELPDELKEAVKGQTYDAITNEESWNRAWDIVSNDLEGSKARLKAKQDLSGADDTMEYIVLLNKTSKSNIAEAKQLATDFAEKSTRSGQAIQAISALQKMTPEGQLVRAMSVKNAGERELKKINPTAFDNFKKLDDEITKSIKQAKEEIADEALNKITDEVELLKDEVSGKTIAKKHDKKTRTPEQILADKIKNALKPKEPKEIDEINQMVSSLFSKAKPKLGIENKPSQAIDKFRIDIKNRQQYAKVWQNAKSILSGELSSDMIKQIDDYFKTGVRPTFKESQLKALMKSTMKDLDINLSDTVKKFASDQITDRNIIKETLLKELNLDNESAEYLSKFIEKNLKDSIKEKRERLLANYFKDFKEKTPTDQSKKIQDIVNLGGLENKKYVDAFKNKLPSVVKQLLKDRNIKMIDILKLTREAQGNVTDDMVNEFLRGLNVDIKYYDQIKNAADDAFKELSDKTRQSYIDKLTREQTKRVERPLREKISELYNLDVLNDLAREKYKLPYFTDDEAKYIVDTMEKASTLEGREKDLLLAKVDQLISDKVPVSLADKVKAIRNMSLLGNIKTIGVRNPLGNLIFSGLENVAQIPSGITDAMVSKILKTERTTKVLPSLSAQAKGFKKGVFESWEDVINNVDTSPTRGGAELPRNRKVFETAWLNKANNWMGDALKFGDRPFYQAAYDARLKELKELSPNADIEDLKKLAHEFGLERTFQNSSTTSKAVGMIKKGLNLGKDFGLGDIIMPYTQTPANILEKGVQYTPLNIINVFGKIGGQALGKETIRNNPKAFADAVGRTFTGTGAIALGYKLAEEENMTGGTTDMSTKEKAIRKEAGEQQYSVKIGDKWYSFDWAQPASIPLAIGVDMYNAGVKKEDVASKLQAGTESGIQTLFNQSMLQGISRLFGGTSIASGYAESLANVPSQFTPTLLSQAAQVTDPYKRDADYSNVKTIAKTSVQKKIPGLRQQLPPTLNLFGEPVKEQGQGITKAIKVFLSPANVSDVNTDRITNEIYSLYKRTGETDVIPSKIPTGLTNEQKYEFKQVFGKKVKRALEQTMRGNYSSATDNDKIKIIRRVINNAYDEAKNELGIGKK